MIPATIRRQAEALDATIEDDSDGGWAVYQITAPYRQRWVDGGPCCLRVGWRAGCPDSRQAQREAWEDATARMACGLRPATAREAFEAAED